MVNWRSGAASRRPFPDPWWADLKANELRARSQSILWDERPRDAVLANTKANATKNLLAITATDKSAKAKQGNTQQGQCGRLRNRATAASAARNKGEHRHIRRRCGLR